jgi:hypothetical protein
VVELKNDRIWLTAVDARMLSEILPGTILVFPGGPIVIHTDASNLMLAIP